MVTVTHLTSPPRTQPHRAAHSEAFTELGTVSSVRFWIGDTLTDRGSPNDNFVFKDLSNYLEFVQSSDQKHPYNELTEKRHCLTMVLTKNVEEEGVSMCESDKSLDGIDINNSCREVYLRRMESIEECKRSTTTVDIEKQTTSIGAALARLRIEMVGLMDQDAGLMRQMLLLNEKVEELKANNICQMSKESLDSQDSLYQMEGQTAEYLLESQDSLYHTDEQSDELSSDDETFEYSEWSKNDSAYSDSDEDTCNITPQSRDCMSSRVELNESESLDSVFDQLLEFDTM